MKQQSEALIQQSIYEAFNNKYCLTTKNPSLIIYAVTNGFGITLPKEMPIYWKNYVYKEIAKKNNLHKKLGMLEGVSDLKIEGIESRVLSIEVKIEIGKQSPAQVKMQSKVEKLNGRYIVVRSLLDFQLQIQNHIQWLTEK